MHGDTKEMDGLSKLFFNESSWKTIFFIANFRVLHPRSQHSYRQVLTLLAFLQFRLIQTLYSETESLIVFYYKLNPSHIHFNNNYLPVSPNNTTSNKSQFPSEKLFITYFIEEYFLFSIDTDCCKRHSAIFLHP